MSETLYKVVRVQDGVGMPCHGGAGDFRWPLPQGDEPGNWVEAQGQLVLCQNGLHLTSSPIDWYLHEDAVRLYEAEYEGEVCQEKAGGKVCVRRARLVREVDWAVAQVFRDGEHSVTSGRVRAYGSASVVAYGSASVRAFGSASVRAYGSASVRAYDSASVEAYDSASVRASGSASVRAFGSASVVASGSASVVASGSASVVSTPYHSPGADVALSQMAAHIDRRGGKLAYRDGLGRSVEAGE